MSSPRKANPKVDLGPDVRLRITNAEGAACWHQSFSGNYHYVASIDAPWSATKFKGPGKASAKSALCKRGYTVEEVPA